MRASSSPVIFPAHWPKYGVTLLCLAIFAIGFADTMLSMPAIWMRQQDYVIGFAAPVLIIWALALHAPILRHVSESPSRSGAVCFLLAFGLWWLASALFVTIGAQIAWVAMFWSLIWAVCGMRAVRLLAMPLAMMIFLVPFGDPLLPSLQWFTAWFALKLLTISGILFHADGYTITLPGGVFYVAEECAGVRFLFSSLLLGSFYAWLAFPDIRRRFIFIALCIAVPIFGNALRAAGIVILADFTDHQLAAGVDHLLYGWIFFGLLLFWLGLIGKMMGGDPSRDLGLAMSNASYRMSGDSSVRLSSIIMPAALLLALVVKMTMPPESGSYKIPSQVHAFAGMVETPHAEVPLNFSGLSDDVRIFSSGAMGASFVFAAYPDLSAERDRGSVMPESGRPRLVRRSSQLRDIPGFGAVREDIWHDVRGVSTIVQIAFMTDLQSRARAIRANLDAVVARMRGQQPVIAVAMLVVESDTLEDARRRMTILEQGWSVWKKWE